MAWPVATYTYGAAAAAFLLLSVLLVLGWRGRLPGMLLGAAAIGTCVSALALAYVAHQGAGSFLSAELAEVARPGLWFAFLVVLLGYSRKAVRGLRLAALGIAGLWAFAVAGAFVWEGLSAARPDTIAILVHLALAVVGIVLVEQLFRNVHPQQRWSIKYLCLALAGMFGFDFYLYSDALLFRSMDPDIWAARGVVYALVVPLIAVATARNPRWSLDVSISRGIVFHSTAMLGASVYLVGMAGVGYYVRYFGGTWGGVLQVASLFAGALLLAALFFSGTTRARLRVFLTKHFFTYRYDYREEWLRFTRMLSEGRPGMELRERSIQAMAGLVESPAGVLWLARDSGTLEPVAHWNEPAAKGMEKRDGALCRFLQERQWVIDLEDWRSDPGRYEGLDMPEWLAATPGAWLIVPLILHDQLLGFVVLARSNGRVKVNWEVNDILKTAGRQAASYLAQLEAARALLIARQFESFNRMSAFVVHDLKNVISQLSLMLSNADRHKHKRAFQEDMLETVAHSVEKMRRLLAQLRGAYTLDSPVALDLHELLRRCVAAKHDATPAPALLAPDTNVSVVAHGPRLERVLGHLLQNAIDATPPTGSVNVRLEHDDGHAVVEIEDTGCGMSKHFIDTRLFSPFESTKATGMGIGAYEAREYVRELRGRIEVHSREGAGSTFRVVLPLAPSEPAAAMVKVAEACQ
jgi:putative PEP-CTERM system histidine kinase